MRVKAAAEVHQFGRPKFRPCLRHLASIGAGQSDTVRQIDFRGRKKRERDQIFHIS